MMPVAFDFRKPPPDELVRQVIGWITLACRQSTGVWSRLLPYPAQLKPASVEAVVASKGFAAFASDTIGIPATTADVADGSLLLAIHRPLLLLLLAGLVGETPTAMPLDREPSDVEASLIEYLARELFFDPLEKVWPTTDPPRLTLGAPATPRMAWAGASGDQILLITATITTPLGDFPIHLMVPRNGRWERLACTEAPRKPVESASREQMEALVQEMAVDLTVIIGTTDLTMHDLAGLGPGDLVILRQKVNQPLDGLVAGARKFRVWPGVIGTRAGVLIDTRVKD